MAWLQIIGAPLLIGLGGIITWIIKSKIEELRSLEGRLREERRKVYRQILEPYIRLFADLKDKGPEEALKDIISYNYKKVAFDLYLFGSDEVVYAYNALMKHTYNAEVTREKKPKEMMRLWGKFLLEIRKSLGNKNTNLNELDMLRGLVKDIEDLER